MNMTQLHANMSCPYWNCLACHCFPEMTGPLISNVVCYDIYLWLKMEICVAQISHITNQLLDKIKGVWRSKVD